MATKVATFSCLGWFIMYFTFLYRVVIPAMTDTAVPHSGHPVPPVPLALSPTTALQLVPQRAHLQAALIMLLAATVSDVLSPLASQSHSAATSGWLLARLLQGQTALPVW